MFDKVVETLSGKKAGFIIVLLAIAARIILQLYFFDITGDRSVQLVAAKSFIEGHGFSVPQVLTDDLNKQVYLPVVGWPPGYSIFLLPLYFVCGKNIIAAAFLFEIISAAMFVIVARRILQLLNVSPLLVNVFTLISGFFIYDFAAASSSDFCTLILFLFSIYCILVFIKKDQSPMFGMLAGVLLFSCLLTRYMYLAIVLPPALYLLYTGFQEKNRRLLKGGCYCILTLIILSTFLFLYQHHFTGSATYLNSPKEGFYPDNLLRTNPVLITPFIDLQVFATTLFLFLKWDYVTQIEIISLIHLAPFCLLLIFCIRFLVQKRNTKKSLVEHYVYLGISSSLCLVFLLFFLSLTNAPQLSVYKTKWTFVQEPRYYAFITLFIHQLLFIYLFGMRATPGKMKRVISTSIALLLGLEFLHGIYFTTKKIVYERQNFIVHPKVDPDVQYLYFCLDSLQRSYPKKQIITASDDATFQNLAVLRGYKSLYNSDINSISNTRTSEKAIFLVVLQCEALSKNKDFIQQSDIKFIGKHARQCFFLLE